MSKRKEFLACVSGITRTMREKTEGIEKAAAALKGIMARDGMPYTFGTGPPR